MAQACQVSWRGGRAGQGRGHSNVFRGMARAHRQAAAQAARNPPLPSLIALLVGPPLPPAPHPAHCLRAPPPPAIPYLLALSLTPPFPPSPAPVGIKLSQPKQCVLLRWGGLMSVLDLERGSELALSTEVECFWLSDVVSHSHLLQAISPTTSWAGAGPGAGSHNPSGPTTPALSPSASLTTTAAALVTKELQQQQDGGGGGPGGRLGVTDNTCEPSTTGRVEQGRGRGGPSSTGRNGRAGREEGLNVWVGEMGGGPSSTGRSWRAGRVEGLNVWVGEMGGGAIQHGQEREGWEGGGT